MSSLKVGSSVSSLEEFRTRLSSSRSSSSTKSTEHDLESQHWRDLDVNDWSSSIKEDSIFSKLYFETINAIEEKIKRDGNDVVVDLGCGSGEISGPLSERLSTKCIGVDINPKFIQHCNNLYPQGEFHVLNLMEIESFWSDIAAKYGYKNPLFICCNNTLSILPLELREPLVCSIKKLVVKGKYNCLFTFWDGEHFENAVKNYYQQNPKLCGTFDESHVDYDARHLETPSGYCTKWFLDEEISTIMRETLNCEIYTLEKKDIGIFVWF